MSAIGASSRLSAARRPAAAVARIVLNWLFLVKNCLGLQLLAIATGYFARKSAARSSVRVSTRLWVADIAGIGITQGVLLFVVGHISEWTLYLWFWVLPWLTINRFING